MWIVFYEALPWLSNNNEYLYSLGKVR